MHIWCVYIIVHVFKYIVSECIHYIQINIHIYVIATLNIYSHYSTSILYYRYIYLYPPVIQFWAVVSYSNAPRSSTNQRKWRLPRVKFGSVWWSFFVAYTQYNLDPIVTINMFTRSHWINWLIELTYCINQHVHPCTYSFFWRAFINTHPFWAVIFVSFVPLEAGIFCPGGERTHSACRCPTLLFVNQGSSASGHYLDVPEI